MGFQFATCNKQMALRHLRAAYPSYEITEENTKKIMEWILKDIVRIQDPDFHSPPMVVAGSNWTENKEILEEIQNAFQEFHNSLEKKKNEN